MSPRNKNEAISSPQIITGSCKEWDGESYKSFPANFWRSPSCLAWLLVIALTFLDISRVDLTLIVLPARTAHTHQSPSPRTVLSSIQRPRTEGNFTLGASSHSKLTHFWLPPLSLWAWHTCLRARMGHNLRVLPCYIPYQPLVVRRPISWPWFSLHLM